MHKDYIDNLKKGWYNKKQKRRASQRSLNPIGQQEVLMEVFKKVISIAFAALELAAGVITFIDKIGENN